MSARRSVVTARGALRFGLVAALTVVSLGGAAAQERCSLSSTFEPAKDGAVVRLHEDCEDSITQISCRRGERRVAFDLPGFARDLGAEEMLTFSFAGRSEKKKAVVAAPDAGLLAAMRKQGDTGTDQRVYRLVVAPDDALWRELTRPGADVAYNGDGWSTAFFIDRAGSARLAALAKACGF